MENKILDATNQPKNASLFGRILNSIHGLPLGASASGEIALKVISAGEGAGAVGGGYTGLPYNATSEVITNVAAGPATIQFKRGSTVIATRTYTYTNGGASATDVLTGVVDT